MDKTILKADNHEFTDEAMLPAAIANAIAELTKLNVNKIKCLAFIAISDTDIEDKAEVTAAIVAQKHEVPMLFTELMQAYKQGAEAIDGNTPSNGTKH